MTTQDFAKVLKLCDSFLIKRYGVDITSLMELDIYNKPEIIYMILESNPELKKIFDNYNLTGLIQDFLYEFSTKKIFKISDEALIVSQKPIELVTDAEFNVSEERLQRLFKALEHNMELYEQLYRDKIWIMDSSLGRSERLVISPTRFFHLMGLDEKDFRKNDNMRKFERMFNPRVGIKSLMTDRKDLFEVLFQMVKNEEDFISAIKDGELKSIINPQKMEVKNFGFERIGSLEHSSGMIFYDKSLAQTIAQAEGQQYNSNIKSDLILLSDFIRKYDLEFIFTPYRQYRHTAEGLDAESLVIPKNHYEQARLYKGQQASISVSARQYAPSDFKYTIKLAEGEEPISDPRTVIEFSDADKARMAESIISALPQLDTEHLKEIYNQIVNNIDKQKRL